MVKEARPEIVNRVSGSSLGENVCEFWEDEEMPYDPDGFDKE